MRKIIKNFALAFSLIALLFNLFSISEAYEIDLQKTGKEQQLLAKVSYKLLNANRIPIRIVVTMSDKKVANARTYYRNSQIVVDKGLITVAGNDDEIAAVIAHEISHALDYRDGILKGYFTSLNSLNSKKYELKADNRGVDFMVKAGYNPLAMITVLHRIAPDGRFDWCNSHPLTSKRLATVYEHIYTNYPEYLVQNEYINNPVYQNFLITSKENRKKFEEKIKTNSTRKVKYQ